MTPSPLSTTIALRSITVYRYRLPLTHAVRWGDCKHRQREGLLVRVRSAEHEGWGDVAPLPGFSAASLDAVAEVCQRDVTSAPPRHVRVAQTEEALEIGWETSDLPPSLAFGIEGAAADLAARHLGMSLSHLFGSAPRTTVAINALVAATPDAIAQATSLRDTGYRTLKLKVGRADWAEEAAVVRTLHAALGADVSLRLDANRAWSVDDARAFAEAVQDVPVAYVEEPLADPAALPAFAAAAPVPVALDETARTLAPADLPAHAYAEAVVLKPSLTGLTTTLDWMRAASDTQTRTVLSSAYESGIGMRLLVALAAAAPSADAAGFGPYRRLDRDVLRPRLPLDGPTVRVAEAVPPSPSVQGSSLDVLAHTKC